jgi:hypothetical protein
MNQKRVNVLVAAVAISSCIGMWTFIRYVQSAENDKRCRLTLSDIESGIAYYREDHEGAYPPDLQTLVTKRIITDDSLRSLQRSAAHVYVRPSGLTPDTKAVLVYEPLISHGGSGSHVLLIDGTNTWLDADSVELKSAIAQTERSTVNH